IYDIIPMTGNGYLIILYIIAAWEAGSFIWNRAFELRNVVHSLQRKIEPADRTWTRTRASGLLPLLGNLLSRIRGGIRHDGLAEPQDIEASSALFSISMATRGTMSLVQKRLRERTKEANERWEATKKQIMENKRALHGCRKEADLKKAELVQVMGVANDAKVAKGILKGIEFGGVKFCHLYYGEEAAINLE